MHSFTRSWVSFSRDIESTHRLGVYKTLAYRRIGAILFVHVGRIGAHILETLVSISNERWVLASYLVSSLESTQVIIGCHGQEVNVIEADNYLIHHDRCRRATHLDISFKRSPASPPFLLGSYSGGRTVNDIFFQIPLALGKVFHTNCCTRLHCNPGADSVKSWRGFRHALLERIAFPGIE